MQAETNGTFIVIEGTDGSGKGTQFQKLAERLVADGYDVATFDFPQYDKPSSHFIKRYLNGDYGTADEVSPYTASLFYALDRFEAAPHIRQALNEGKIVLANRYVGSNMAHQGAKFFHAEERRGYFIWLDNLEFLMLKIPRPTMSFVLRVPAAIAQKLVGDKPKRSYTDKTHDVHEADLSHLQKSVEVYDDLAQLFPKDFTSIDCARGEQILPIDAIHDLLWERVSAYLPPKPKAKKPAKKPAVAATATSDATSAPADEPNQIAAMEASALLLQELGKSDERVVIEQTDYASTIKKGEPEKHQYYTPAIFDNKTQQTYKQAIEKIFEMHSQIVRRLTLYVRESSSTPKAEQDASWQAATRAEARRIAQAVLPMAATSVVAITAAPDRIKSLAARLNNNDLFESQQAASRLLGIKQNTDTLATKSGTGKLRKLADELLKETYDTKNEPVSLVSYSPRNELDLIADMLYEHSGAASKTLKQTVSMLTYDQKAKVFNAALKSREASAALAKAAYVWEFLTDSITMRDIQTLRLTTAVEQQALTPRYGYDIPKAVEDAGLAEAFEACFDLSLELHSHLQAAGYIQESQYAVLQGHRLRWRITLTAAQLPQLLATQAPITPQIKDLLSQSHPLLTESVIPQTSE